uniref:Uncharacterized protein n=1 Tax=Cynoglossus semilaevis TaxID=244447 RepID=A0A3P8WIK2_CYNSE
MQLEEKRQAIEHHKKKMEVLSARQRQMLGKAAFLLWSVFLLGFGSLGLYQAVLLQHLLLLPPQVLLLYQLPPCLFVLFPLPLLLSLPSVSDTP